MAAAHVIGLGRSGIASARLLQKQGWSVTLSDAGLSESLKEKQKQLEAEGIKVLLDCRFSLNHLNEIEADKPEQIIVSPGVPWDLPALIEARAAGIEMMGEMELAWRNLKQFPWIGITGTNGKTTTTALTEAIFKAAGLNAPACGNIGYSACELALKGDTLDWVIAEISSYQIESASTLSPHIGIWTTFTPDHLERHGTIECYRAIKAALINQSTHKVINGDDPILNEGLTWRWPEAWWTLTHPVEQHDSALKFVPKAFIQEDWVTIDGQRILDIKQLKMQGNHNLQNMLLAVSAAYLAGIAPEAIADGVANFPGVEHRLEHVGSVNGVELINDSKATNYDAAFTGLAAVKGPAILIAGGSPKQGDDSLWIKTIKQKAVSVLLIGDAAPQFAQQLEANQYTDYEIVETMDKAVDRAINLSESLNPKSILLSPACASFDQYPNFEKRGEHFKSLCQNHL